MFMHFLMPFDSNETLQKELPWPKLFEAYCFDANEASQPIFSDLMSNLFWWFWCRQNNRTIGLQMAQWIADSLDARKTSSASLEVSKMSKSILAFQHRLTAPWHVYEARVVFNSAWRWQTSSTLNARANELLLLPSTCFLVYNILWSYDINTFKLTDFETWCWGSVELKNTEYCSHVVFQARLTSSIELDGWFSCHTFVFYRLNNNSRANGWSPAPAVLHRSCNVRHCSRSLLINTAYDKWQSGKTTRWTWYGNLHQCVCLNIVNNY